MSPPAMSMLGVFVQPITVRSNTETQFFATSKEGESVAVDRSLSFLGRQVAIKGSSMGFLLCSFELEPPHINYCICNPLTREWKALPRRPKKARCNTAVGFSCNLLKGTTLDSVAFQVVMATAITLRDSTMRLEIATFSSETVKWRRWRIKSNLQLDRLVTGPNTKVFLIDEVIYWMRTEDLWAYDTKKHRLERVERPVGDDANFGTWSHSLGQSKGKLYFARSNCCTDLEVWILNKKSTGGNDWVLYAKKRLLTALNSHRRPGSSLLSLEERAGRFLSVRSIHPRDSRRILMVWCGSLYWYHLNTDKLELLISNNARGVYFVYERPASSMQPPTILFSRL